ncbi:MAG: preprotein translocase subunit SecG, partial [Chloroflexi bacterium CFX6]|nr:preprotein translocase subunit SecG [Chloroflexi bacterium CFX6]
GDPPVPATPAPTPATGAGEPPPALQPAIEPLVP